MTYNINNWLEDIDKQHSPEPETENPYLNLKVCQERCSHYWENGRSAITITPNGERVCAICQKKF